METVQEQIEALKAIETEIFNEFTPSDEAFRHLCKIRERIEFLEANQFPAGWDVADTSVNAEPMSVRDALNALNAQSNDDKTANYRGYTITEKDHWTFVNNHDGIEYGTYEEAKQSIDEVANWLENNKEEN